MIQRIMPALLAILFLYLSYQGFFNGHVMIRALRGHWLSMTGTACFIASIGLLVMSIGIWLRIFTDSNDEFSKFYTRKTIPFLIGLCIIVVSILYHAAK
jgi:uncharacterized membrane protein YidH (DUF202 family)